MCLVKWNLPHAEEVKGGPAYCNYVFLLSGLRILFIIIYSGMFNGDALAIYHMHWNEQAFFFFNLKYCLG